MEAVSGFALRQLVSSGARYPSFVNAVLLGSPSVDVEALESIARTLWEDDAPTPSNIGQVPFLRVWLDGREVCQCVLMVC